MTTADEQKQQVGERVAEWIDDGMTVGLGTGSTAAWAIRALGERVRKLGLRIQGVPTSFFADRLARECGIPVVTLDEVSKIDLSFDGADEVDPGLNLIKGRGAAHTREKVVAASAERFVVLVDESKIVDRLGTRMPVPVECLPMALAPVERALINLGGRPSLRMGTAKDGPAVTDQGFWILDAWFDNIESPARMSDRIKLIPGVLDHGIFPDMATDVLVGGSTVQHLKRT